LRPLPVERFAVRALVGAAVVVALFAASFELVLLAAGVFVVALFAVVDEPFFFDVLFEAAALLELVVRPRGLRLLSRMPGITFLPASTTLPAASMTLPAAPTTVAAALPTLLPTPRPILPTTLPAANSSPSS
jgi:hypothetical protein